MAYDGALKFDTKVDQSGFTSGIAQLKSTALSAIGAIGGAFAAGAIVQGMVAAGKEGIQLASSLAEVQNVIDVTFESGSESVNEFAKSAKNAYGLSELAAKQYTGVLGAMLKSMGLTLDAVEDMSTSMTGLAGDFASFYNISTDEAFQKIRAGIAGETEPLRQLGINMSVANLEAYALAQGIDATYASMTQAQQATLRYNYLMSVSADAQGDFARTSDSYANSQRLAALATDELKIAIGNRLMPVAKQFQQEFANIAGAAAEALSSRGITGVVDVITDKFPLATAAVAGLTSAFVAMLIVNSVNAAVKAFTETEKLLTLATTFGTLAQWNELGALTAKQIVVAALTGKVGLATAAQWLWNAAIQANPVMILVTAIGLLVGGVVLLTKNFDKLNPSIAETREEIQSLDKAIKESESTYADSSDSIERQKFELDGIVEKLDEASKSYKGSSIEQAKMRSMCDTLSSSVDGLSVTFDEQSGALSMNVSEIYNLIDAQYDLARATAASGRYQELVTNQLNAQFEVYKAKKEYDKFNAPGAKFDPLAKDAAYINYKNALELEAQATSDVQSFEGFNGVLGETSASINELAESEAGLAKEIERVIIGGYDVTDILDEIGMTADEVAARLDNFTGAATNMFEKISTESKIKVADMISNLEANAIAIEDWGDNIAYLGSKLPSDLLQPLIDQGPVDMAGVLNQLAGASDTELANLAAAFSNGGEEAKEAWLLSLGAGMEEENPLLGVLDGATEAAAESGTQFSQALITSINSQNYSGAASSLTSAFRSSFESMKGSFSQFLERVHFDLAYTIGGVKQDMGALAQEVKTAFAKIPTLITVRVNVIYSSSGSVGGAGGVTGVDATKPMITGGGVYAPITVQGVVQSDTQLANTITRNFGEVMYGRNS